MSLSKGFTQGGSNADVVLVDAYVKNLTGINWEDAYSAIVNDAENEPIDWSVEGRGGLMSWKSLDYIPYLDFDYLASYSPVRRKAAASNAARSGIRHEQSIHLANARVCVR